MVDELSQILTRLSRGRDQLRRLMDMGDEVPSIADDEDADEKPTVRRRGTAQQRRAA